MAQNLNRLFIIIACLSLSIIAVHKMRAPQRLFLPRYKAFCIPLEKVTPEFEAEIHDLYHIAHTSLEQTGKVKSYRCYIQFPPSSVVCVPAKKGQKSQKLSECPQYITSTSKACYFLTDKYNGLLEELKKTPPISREVYKGIAIGKKKELKRLLIKK